MKEKIINYFQHKFDTVLLKDKIKLLEKRVKELENEKQPLIDLCNKRLSEIRVKNLEIGRLKGNKNKENRRRQFRWVVATWWRSWRIFICIRR